MQEKDMIGEGLDHGNWTRVKMNMYQGLCDLLVDIGKHGIDEEVLFIAPKINMFNVA